MMGRANFVAIDLGAASGRVFVSEWDGQKFHLGQLHRFSNSAVRANDHLYWDVLRLWSEIKIGLHAYKRKCQAPAVSVGVDAWGVDFVLLDSSGHLIGNPHSYRDSRTNGAPAAVFAKIPEVECFQETGIRSMSINTLFQLFSMVQGHDPQLEVAATLLMLPDLFTYWLGGSKSTEYTAASTSEMLAKRNTHWANDFLSRLAIPTHILPDVSLPGCVVGKMQKEIVREVGFAEAPSLISVAAHDTASAVAAIPKMDRHSVFLSSGTWNLMGVETTIPVTTREALDLRFSNEGGVHGSILLLRNITGFWLLQECVHQWERQGESYEWQDLMRLAQSAAPFRSLLDPDSAEFECPENMLLAIRTFCRNTGQAEPELPGEFARCCLESICFRQREVLECLERLTQSRLGIIRIVGGGCHNHLFCQFTADASGRCVVAGPVEATVLGNVLVQAVAAGHVRDIQQGREAVAESVEQLTYQPELGSNWDEAFCKFKELRTRNTESSRREH
jgi:rhamnulokinase